MQLDAFQAEVRDAVKFLLSGRCGSMDRAKGKDGAAVADGSCKSIDAGLLVCVGGHIEADRPPGPPLFQTG